MWGSWGLCAVYKFQFFAGTQQNGIISMFKHFEQRKIGFIHTFCFYFGKIISYCQMYICPGVFDNNKFVFFFNCFQEFKMRTIGGKLSKYFDAIFNMQIWEIATKANCSSANRCNNPSEKKKINNIHTKYQPFQMDIAFDLNQNQITATTTKNAVNGTRQFKRADAS